MKNVLRVLVVATALMMGWVCLKAQGAEYHSFYYSPRGGWSYGYHYQPRSTYRGYRDYRGDYSPRCYSYPYRGYHGYHSRPRHRCHDDRYWPSEHF